MSKLAVIHATDHLHRRYRPDLGRVRAVEDLPNTPSPSIRQGPARHEHLGFPS